jgi:hypothetical protein
LVRVLPEAGTVSRWQNDNEQRTEKGKTMRLITVAEMLRDGSGRAVEGTRIQLKRVNEYHDGTNSFGPWSIQNVIGKDGTGEIKLKLTNRKELTKKWEGVWVIFEEGPGDKGRMTGLLTKDDNYKGKTTLVLEIGKEAVMTQADSAGSQAESQRAQDPSPGRVQEPQEPPQRQREPEDPPQRQEAPPSRQSAERPAPEPSREPEPAQRQAEPVPPPKKTPEQELAEAKRHVRDLKRFVSRRVNAFEIILSAVDHLAERRRASGRAIPPEQQSSIAMSLFIAADRAGMGYPMPTGDLDKYLDVKPADANPPVPPGPPAGTAGTGSPAK